MKSAGKARNNGLYRHIRTSKEIIRNLLNDSLKSFRKYFMIVPSHFILRRRRTRSDALYSTRATDTVSSPTM